MPVAKPTNDDVKSRISKLFFEESFCDVTFLVDNPSHRCHCHKLILATGSKVFEAMLYGKMAETTDIRIPDVTEMGFRTMLRYLYTDTVKLESESAAFETAYCAKKYLIDNLFKMCENYLISEAVLNIETVLTLYEKAAFLELKKLQSQCLRFVSRHASEILVSPKILGISVTTFEDILQLEFMHIASEKVVIESLWKWGKEKCKEKGVDKSFKNIRKSTESLLKYVRFLSLGLKELENVFQKFDLLDNVEQLAFLWNIAMSNRQDSARLPSNLCSNFKNRSIHNASRLGIPTEYRYNGDFTSISLKRFKQHIDLSFEGPGITIFGAIVAMKPIPCYSPSHRQLKIDITLCNGTTSSYSKAKLSQKVETQGYSDLIEVLLEEFVHFEDGDIGILVIETIGEGVRIMECSKAQFSLNLDNTVINCNFKVHDRNSLMLPIKELICIPD